MSRQSLTALVAWYESMSAESVARVGEFYAADAHFVDPFNDVRGVAAIAAIFRHMFVQVEAPRFVVEGCFEGEGEGEGEAMLTWRFVFLSRGKAQVIQGATALCFDAAGKVTTHRDYWDPARELYSHLPVLGSLLRWLAARLAAPQARL